MALGGAGAGGMAGTGAGGFNRKIRKLKQQRADGGMVSNQRFNNKLNTLKQGRKDFRINKLAQNTPVEAGDGEVGQSGVDNTNGIDPGFSMSSDELGNTSGGMGRGTPAGGFNKKIRRLKQRHDQGMVGDNRFQNKLSTLKQGRRDFRQGNMAADQAPPPGTDPGNSTDPPVDPNAPTQEGVTNSLFPGQDSFLPENYEGSPMYKFQQQEGGRALDRLYASRGLNKSGAEVEGNIRFQNQLGAQEAQRQQGVAQQEADRYERMSGRESDRMERRDDAGWRRATDMMGFGERAINNIAGLKKGRKKAKANWLANNYARAFGGGGASAGARPTHRPEFGGPPDMSWINGAAGVGNSAGNSNWYDDIGSIISSIF